MPGDGVSFRGEGLPGPFCGAVTGLERRVLHFVGDVAGAEEEDVGASAPVGGSGLAAGRVAFLGTDSFDAVAIGLVFVALQRLVGVVAGFARLVGNDTFAVGVVVRLHPVSDLVVVPAPGALHQSAAGGVAVVDDKLVPVGICHFRSIGLSPAVGEVDQIVVHVRIYSSGSGVCPGISSVWRLHQFDSGH
ncbi:hypothetical protein [Streptomyces sp. NP-1717]|uniref:hypothetical protein n=1 Tax=Streptomyces sp. NP-1717 TaxID=2704470 RepID=UPI001F5C10E5|nr:hypothetical protein [Streptomyces sp. NP-1717]MCI3220866.1 hypothetical protein [Streptomyces sp. NP-1717]